MLIITFIVCGVFSIGNPSDEPHCPPNGLPDCPPGAYWILIGFMDILENLAVLFFQMTFQWNFYPIIVIEIKKAATQKSSIVLIFWYDCFIYKHWMFVFFFWSEKFKIVRKHFHSRYSIFFVQALIDEALKQSIYSLVACKFIGNVQTLIFVIFDYFFEKNSFYRYILIIILNGILFFKKTYCLLVFQVQHFGVS